jgi:hypothetical protein
MKWFFACSNALLTSSPSKLEDPEITKELGLGKMVNCALGFTEGAQDQNPVKNKDKIKDEISRIEKVIDW